MPSLKQSEAEYSANIAAFEKSILPAVLKAVPSNGQHMSAWLLKNCTDANGVVDASVANLRRAYAHLSTVDGLLDWTVAPIKPKSKSEMMAETGRKNHARPEEEVKTPTASEQAVGFLKDKREQLSLAEGERFIEGFGAGMTHSKRAAARDQLKAFWEKGLDRDFTGTPKKKPTKALEALRKYGEGLWK